MKITLILTFQRQKRGVHVLVEAKLKYFPGKFILSYFSMVLSVIRNISENLDLAALSEGN